MARIWNLRLNLDEFNSSLAGLDSDAERLAFLSGFNAGLNGRFKKDIAGPWESGWKVGNTSHVEAIKFSEKQRAKALLRDYHGHATASPRHDSGNATAMPNDNRQSTIQESKNPRTMCARDEHDIAAPADSTPPAADADRWAYVRTEPWAKTLVKAGCKIGPQNWPAWQALVASHGHDRVADVAKTCPATDRWPDRTETALLKSGGQAPIAQAIHHRIRIIKT